MIWSTKTISTFVAATVPVETEGAENKLLEQAYQIGVTDLGKATEEASSKAAGAVNEPANGSFERFMASFGSPQRWAGR